MKMLRALLLIVFFILPMVSQAEQKQLDITTTLMRSTFKIQDRKSFGTVFIMGQPSPDTPGKLYYVLITAAHVLEGMRTDTPIIHLRKQEGEKFSRLSYRLQIRKNGKPLWVKHPDVDIAAMRVRLPKEADIPLISTNLFETDDILEQFQVHPGDQLLVLGFPYGAEANDAGFPILRSGRIASYPLIPIKTNKTFLIDFEVFPGNSGGPVLFYSENRLYGGSTHPGSVQFIMGIVSQEKEVTERVDSMSETVLRKHRLALGVVSHASFVADLIKMLPPVEN
jgi:hypothetical protein